jgi:nucleobindin
LSWRLQDEIEHQKKAETIVNTVLDLVDKDKDGRISLSEFTSVGLDGLPNFDELGAEGHHYDVESGMHRIAF